MRNSDLYGIELFWHRCRLLVFAAVVAAWTLSPLASACAQSYLQRVIDFGDTMLDHGTDRYGADQTPQFTTALTRTPIPELVIESPKLSAWPPRYTLLPNVFNGSDYAHKITIRGGDVGTDGELYKMLYLLTDITGDTKYETAADASLTYFLENTPDPVTGLFTWSEHTGWDFRDEVYLTGNDVWSDPQYQDKHEFQSGWDLYEKFAQLPASGNQVLEDFANGIWTQHVWNEGRKLRYSRHGQIGTLGNAVAQNDKGMFPRHGGYFVNTMSAAFSYSVDAAFRSTQLDRMDQFVTEWERQYQEYGYIPFDLPNGNLSQGQNGTLAEQLREAAPRLDIDAPALAQRMMDLADNISPLQMEFEKVGDLMTSGISNRGLGKNTQYFDEPDYNIGWDLPGKVPSQHAEAISKLVNAAIENDPAAPFSQSAYLDRAVVFADEAVDLYLDDGTGSPLPRMLDKNSPILLVDGVTTAPAFYHSYTGGAELMYELLRLDGFLGGDFDLLLEVNTKSPFNVTLKGDLGLDVLINSLQITSDQGSLDPTGWNSLADQGFEGDYDGNGTIDGADFLKLQIDGGTPAQLAEWEAHYGNSGPGSGWEESGGVSTNLLGETFLLGDSTIGAGASIDLGTIFNKQPGNPSLSEDWQFTYRTASGLIKTGVVSYVSAVAASSAVPEPSSLALIGLGLLGMGTRRRKQA